jgi:hypothetical protein
MTATRSQSTSSSKRQSTAASAAAAKAPARRRAASNSAAVVPAVNTKTPAKTTSKATVATPKGENPKSLIQAHAAGNKKFYKAHGATHKRRRSKASGQKVSSSISKQRGAAAASTKSEQSNIITAWAFDPSRGNLYRQLTATVTSTSSYTKVEQWETYKSLVKRYTKDEIAAHLSSGRLQWREERPLHKGLL